VRIRFAETRLWGGKAVVVEHIQGKGSEGRSEFGKAA
jgi:hypothetical protein